VYLAFVNDRPGRGPRNHRSGVYAVDYRSVNAVDAASLPQERHGSARCRLALRHVEPVALQPTSQPGDFGPSLAQHEANGSSLGRAGPGTFRSSAGFTNPCFPP